MKIRIKGFDIYLIILTIINCLIIFIGYRHDLINFDIKLFLLVFILLTIFSSLTIELFTGILYRADLSILVFSLIYFPYPIIGISLILANIVSDLILKKEFKRIYFNANLNVLSTFTSGKLIYIFKSFLISKWIIVIFTSTYFIAFTGLMSSIALSLYFREKKVSYYFIDSLKKAFYPQLICIIVVEYLVLVYPNNSDNYFVLVANLFFVNFLSYYFLKNNFETKRNIKYMNAIFHNSNMGIVLLDKNNLIIKVNKFVNELFNVEFEDYSDFFKTLKTKNFNLFDKSQTEDILHFGNKVVSAKLENVIENNTRAKIGTIIIFEDITEKEVVKEQSRLLEKLSIAGELAASIAHEIRNPLTTIKGFVQLMHERHLKGKEDEFVEVVLEDINRVSNVLSEFLGLARPYSIKENEVNISKIVSECVLLLEPNAFMNDISINKNINEVPLITAEEEKLKQTFLNIIHNAIQACNPGDVIDVSVKTDDENNILVIIKDNGCGMDEQTAKQIFEPFFTTKKDGTGLGLALSYRFITEVKGTINVESIPGLGTTFTVTIPID